MQLTGIMIGSENPARLAEYYTKLFGPPVWEDGAGGNWQIGSGWLTVVHHDRVQGTNAHPGRILWNIETADVKAEFERLKAAGATVVKEPYNPMETPDAPEFLVCTFSDPDENYFQLMSPMEMPAPS